MADLELVALTRERATRLTGLTARQLDYWDATGPREA
jgi:DNA-binding transcriptional MerR regulator